MRTKPTTRNCPSANASDHERVHRASEEPCTTPVTAWADKQEAAGSIARVSMPMIVVHGKTMFLYLDRGMNLMRTASINQVFTFDDHELVTDIWGVGRAGTQGGLQT